MSDKLTLVPTFSYAERLFIERYLELRDLEEMVDENHSLADIQAFWEKPALQAECRRRVAEEEIENVRILTRARKLRQPAFLDAHTVENIEQAEPGADKTKALALGYTVVGVLAKNELSVQPETTAKPNVYRALQTTTVRRITEEVTQTTELQQGDGPALIPADDPEIMDY